MIAVTILTQNESNIEYAAMAQLAAIEAAQCPTCADTYKKYRALPLHCGTCDRSHAEYWAHQLRQRATAIAQRGLFDLEPVA